MSDSLVILFEDPHCLAVVKPPGLLTQARGTSADEPTLEAAVRRYLNPGAPQLPYLGTVHRLDRPVSGVVLWAKTPKAARRLAEQFTARTAVKEYWAVVEGTLPEFASRDEPDEVWDDWLLPADAAGVVRPAAAGAARARHAITRVRRMGWPAAEPQTQPPRTWLRLWPQTGRTHQLRAQAACRGRPVVGDRNYGSVQPFPCGIALHGRALTVHHPVLKTSMTWVAPLPAAWSAAGMIMPVSAG
jgi:23S rRNA-/tRNA-specific pseudouridylate synthase